MTEGIYLVEDGSVARLVLDLPPVNAISTKEYESLIEIFRALEERPDLLVVVLESSNPKVFSAGADIREVRDIVNSSSAEPEIRRQRLAREAYELLVGLRQVTIAAVGGLALGAGAVLAACCDIRVGSVATRIGLTEVNVVRCGGASHLSRILPQGIVRQMYFTTEPLDAETLFRLGAIDQLREAGTETAAAMQMARAIATKSPLSLRVAKRALNAIEALPLNDGYGVEQDFTLHLARSYDAREAAASFLEKRTPVWEGR